MSLGIIFPNIYCLAHGRIMCLILSTSRQSYPPTSKTMALEFVMRFSRRCLAMAYLLKKDLNGSTREMFLEANLCERNIIT